MQDTIKMYKYSAQNGCSTATMFPGYSSAAQYALEQTKLSNLGHIQKNRICKLRTKWLINYLVFLLELNNLFFDIINKENINYRR